MPGLNKKTKNQIAVTLDAAAHGSKVATARQLADMYQVSVSSIYRCAEKKATKRPRQPGHPEYREWVKVATRIAHQSPRPIPLDLVLESAIDSGALPPEAAAMPLGTAHRIRRELGLTRTDKRTYRMAADYPMQAIQVDGSSSEIWAVDQQLDGGDWLLKLYRRPWTARGYKNKPLGPDRERCLAYGVWDMCTGFRLAKYTVGRGENALDALEFLLWSMAEKDDPRIPFHGVPTDLWSDQGPLFKSGPAADLLDRLDINLVTGEAHQKTRMGGVERTWRTMWNRFERTMFLRAEETIKLSELNARLMEYCIRENATRTARTPVAGKPASRAAAWVALTNGRASPLRKLPAGALATLAQEARRKLDANGILRWDGFEYEVPRLHSCWVVARRALDGSRTVMVECEATGQRETATEFTPRPYGEIRTAATLPLQALLDSDHPTITADIYAPAAAPVASNIRPLPGRSAPAAELENPLDAGSFNNLTEAMIAFSQIWPHALSAANRQLVQQQILNSGLRRSAVAELAMNLINHTAREAQ